MTQDRPLPHHPSMGRPPARRVTFDPLDDNTSETLALRYGVSSRTVVRWRINGIPLPTAEAICDDMGVHPAELWATDDLYGDDLHGDDDTDPDPDPVLTLVR